MRGGGGKKLNGLWNEGLAIISEGKANILFPSISNPVTVKLQDLVGPSRSTVSAAITE